MDGGLCHRDGFKLQNNAKKKKKKEGLRVRVGEGGGGRGSEKYLIVVQRLVNRKRSSRMEWGGCGGGGVFDNQQNKISNKQKSENKLSKCITFKKLWEAV